MPEAQSKPKGGPEREFEIGRDEAWSANLKRTYDEYQDVSLETIRMGHQQLTQIVQNATQDTEAKRLLANQALQNAVETANMVSKQAVRHGDLAIDRQWNVDEVATLTAKTAVPLDAIAAALAGLVAKQMGKE